MSLSNTTAKILKNFSGINEGIVFYPGNEIRTTDVNEIIYAEATINETIPFEFGVGKLAEFLRVYSMQNKGKKGSMKFYFEENGYVIKGPYCALNHFTSELDKVYPLDSTEDERIKLPGIEYESGFVVKNKATMSDNFKSKLDKVYPLDSTEDERMTLPVYEAGIVVKNKESMRRYFENELFKVYPLDSTEDERMKLPWIEYEKSICLILKNKGVVRYLVVNPLKIVSPREKRDKFTDKEVGTRFSLTKDVFKKILNAHRKMKLKNLVITSEGVKIFNRNQVIGEVEIDIPDLIYGGKDVSLNPKFFRIMMPLNYDVKFSTKGVVCFSSTDKTYKIDYYIDLSTE